jgi:hypothetical protein
MSQPVSVSGQVIDLYERGYSPDEIYLEVRSRPGQSHVSMRRISAALRQVKSRSADSRRLYEVYEAVLETLALVRAIASDAQKKALNSQIRGIEKRLTKSEPSDIAL